MYMMLKHLHLTFMGLSILGFVFRAMLSFKGSPLLQKKWLKIAPHIVDTLLLASAIGLTIVIHQYPFVHAWLTAKVLALIAYIVLGAIALKQPVGPTKILALLAALACFIYIVGTAFSKNPAFFLG